MINFMLFTGNFKIKKFRKLRCSEVLFRDKKSSNLYTTLVDKLPFGRLIKKSKVILKLI
jgi:hypothetical protein